MTDGVFQLVSTIISNYGFTQSIDQTKPLLAQLPRELQSLLLKTAEHNLDFTYSVRTLLMIWTACMENPGFLDEINTPKYLYNDPEGRAWILKMLGQYQHKVTARRLSLQMYNFYNNSSKFGCKTAINTEFIMTEGKVYEKRVR